MVFHTETDSDSGDSTHSDNVPTETDHSDITPQNLVHDHDTLEHLFQSVHIPLVDPRGTCEAIKPFVIRAMLKYPTSNVLKEAIVFLDNGIKSGSDLHENTPEWTCTTSQINAIVGILNGNQLLIEDEVCTPPTICAPAISTTQSDTDFLSELEAFSL
jgi:hypothetical protein